ncbi:MAG: heavy metal-binding domain-containing protein [Candidatus Dormiibacterota bacterium]
MPREDAAELERQQASIASLERGGLPVAAQERIDELREGKTAWTSDLSVSEMAAIQHAGFEPIGMVMGSSVFRIAAQWGYTSVFGTAGTAGGRVRTYPCTHGFYGGYGGYGGYGMGGGRGMGMGVGLTGGGEHRTGYNWEHRYYEAGITETRNTALRRILEEARGLSAHGVVGVRILRRHLEGVGNSLEFTCIGTAIRRPGAPPLGRDPFMSHLDGNAFSKLLHGGYVPIALVMGIGAMEIDPGCSTEWQLRSWANARVPQVSDGIEEARMLGINHLEAEIAAVDADGAVGVSTDFASYELGGESTLVELFLLGTAVRRYAKDPLDEAPIPIMRLR